MRKTYIYVLTLAALPNDKHMAVAEYMARALKMFSIANTIVSRFVEAYLEAYDKENQAFQRIDRKELTKKMNQADTDRINALRILRDALKIFLIVKNAEKNSAAARILDVIDLYGGAEIYNQPIDARTGNINNIIEDLETELAAAVEMLELGNVVENLKAANELFLSCQSDRNLSDADYGKGAMAEARTELDNIWRALVEEVNNAIKYGTSDDREALIPFAKYMNVEIDKYRIQTGQGVGGNWGSGTAGSADEEEDGVKVKTARFTFANGNSVSLKFEVGAPIVAPENTAGYEWKPEVPEVMPAMNKNFREVAIEAKKFTALFHFADHKEEEIKQVAGSALTAPENTAGYVWDPTVPATMPAEDTTYYEIVAEEETEQKPGEGEQKPGEGEQQPTLYKITYMHKGQVYAVQEYEVGARITTIDPPQGYYWRETTPGIMPAHDITITSTDDPYGIL